MLQPTPANYFFATVIATWMAILAPCPFVVAQHLNVEVNPVSGPKVSGTIVAIDVGLDIVSTSAGRMHFSFEQIDSIQSANNPQIPTDAHPKIQLVDGSELNATSIAIESRKLKVKLHYGVDLEVPTRDVEFIRFRTYEKVPEVNRQWRNLLDDDSQAGDAIVINRNDELSQIEGIIGDLDQETLNFSIEDRTARVALEKLDAILFYHASGREFDPPVCELVLSDHSKLLVREIVWESPTFKAVTVCGAEILVSGANVSRLNFSTGRDVWLSSMEPSTNDWQPLITSSAILEKLRRMKLARVNQSFSGKPLSLELFQENASSLPARTEQFENGFAMQSGGKLAFGLNRRFVKLTGWVGFDPTANPNGNVLFKISVDGKIVMEKHLTRRTMSNPIELNVDIKDADRIVFQVDYHDRRSTGDQLNLVNLKVSR